MRIKIFIFFSVSVIIGTLACTMDNFYLSNPASMPTPVELIEIPTATQFPMPTSTSPAFLSTTSVTTPFPAWVTEFSYPILAALEDQQPDFQDEFSPICIDEFHKWKVCSTPEWRPDQSPLVSVTARPTLDLQPDLQKGYSMLNKGWFYVVPNSLKNPYYAHIENGTLLLKLPEGDERKDSMVYSPHLRYENFVLSLNFQFDKTQPNAAVRFQFNQSSNQSVAFDLAKDQTWTFHWGAHNNWQSRSGTYENFPPDQISIVIIMRGAECAVYVDKDPLDYFSNCRTDAIVQKSPQAVSFHVLADPGFPATVIIDNVNLWDLDKVQDIP